MKSHVTPICRCDNCDHRCKKSTLQAAQDLDQRLDYPVGDPKCVLPAGECPRCGALSYPEPDRGRSIVAALLLQERQAARELRMAESSKWPLVRIHTLEVGKIYAHNMAEIARRLVNQGVQTH